MKAALITLAALIVLDAIALLLLKHEHNKRKTAEKKAQDAAHNVKVLTGYHKDTEAVNEWKDEAGQKSAKDSIRDAIKRNNDRVRNGEQHNAPADAAKTRDK